MAQGDVFKYLGAFKWRCSRCQNWNNIERGVCSQCKAPAQQIADAFRVENKLTAAEENFYQGTARYILAELKTIRQLLQELVGGK